MAEMTTADGVVVSITRQKLGVIPSGFSWSLTVNGTVAVLSDDDMDSLMKMLRESFGLESDQAQIKVAIQDAIAALNRVADVTGANIGTGDAHEAASAHHERP
jgi:hypothetical protein